MPLYHFKCGACGNTKRLMLDAKVAREPRQCTECRGSMKRDPNPPSTQVMESLDNGAMVRKVERLSKAEELYRDRARNDPRNKKLPLI